MTSSQRAITHGPDGDFLGLGRKYIPIAVLAWAWVSVPFAYGVYQLLTKIGPLFS